MKWLVESTLLESSEPGLEPRSLCLSKAALASIHEATFLFAAHSAASPRLRKMVLTSGSRCWACSVNLLGSLSEHPLLCRCLWSLSVAGPIIPSVARPVPFPIPPSGSAASRPTAYALGVYAGWTVRSSSCGSSAQQTETPLWGDMCVSSRGRMW